MFKRVGLAASPARKAYGYAMLIWAYAHVRIHLYSLNVNFYDFDPPNDVLKQLLLEECISALSNKKRGKESSDQDTMSHRKRSRMDNIRKSYSESDSFDNKISDEQAIEVSNADESASNKAESAANVD